MTLIDGLDTLAILGDRVRFQKGVALILDTIDFDALTTQVSLFEVTIRVLGGLLSSHLYASDPSSPVSLVKDGYDGGLLRLATQLADKLLPAFDTETGIPFNIIHFKDGPQKNETDTCTAAAGSLLLEFGTLSRLTDNPVYEVSSCFSM